MSTALQGLSPLESYRELTDFARRCGENALRLAMHCAVPQSFRPELLHLLKLNFLPEAVRDLAVDADVLLAPFTENLSGGYYQFDPETRRQLLDRLDAAHPQRKGSRLQQVARFLAGYVNREEEKLEGSADPLRRDFLEIQRWVALAYIDPDSAARQLAYALDHTAETDRGAVRLQIGGLIRSLSAPLAAHPELLIYAAGLRSLEEGRFQEGRQLLERLGPAAVQVAGLKLRPVEEVITEWRSRLKAPLDEADPQTEAGTIIILTEAGTSSWSAEPLYQRWTEAGFRIECLSMSRIPFGTEEEAREFGSAHNAVFLILDELALDPEPERLSCILGLPSLPVIPIWRSLPSMRAASEQYLSNRFHFGWWAEPVKLDKSATAQALEEQVKAAVSKVTRWTRAPENALDVALQQLAFFRQYGAGPTDGLRARVEREVQNNRSKARELFERADVAAARALLEKALAAHKEAQRAKTLVEAELLAELGQVLTAQGDLERTISLLEEALDGAYRFESKYLQISALSNLGEIHLRLNQPEEGQPLLEKALVLAEEMADPRSAQIRELLTQLTPEPATEGSSVADRPSNEEPARTEHDVFISYASRDKAVGLAIDEYLEQRGIHCWIAPRNIQFGAEWAKSITHAIAQCRVMIVVVSQSANESAEIVRELQLATEARKIVIPFRIDSARISPEIDPYLGRLNSIDATGDWKNSLPTLAARIEEKLRGDAPPSIPSLAFVSYAREDSDFTLRLVIDLKAGGASVWLDQLDVLPGSRWDAEVEKALTACSVLLAILSPAAVDSGNAMDEVAFALDEKKTVIPVLYADCKIPFRLRPLQYVDFRTDYQPALQQLLKHLTQPKPLSEPPVQRKPSSQQPAQSKKLKGFFTGELEEATRVSSPRDAAQIRCKVFLNYRREDASGWAGRLYDNLRARVGRGGEILMDIDSLEPGTDFVQAIERTIGSCQVMLVVIGPQWSSAIDDRGQPRISDPDDFVATEIRIALEEGLVMIPVLVGGATFPSLSNLPPGLAQLTTRLRAELSDKNWQSDIDLLVQRIDRLAVRKAPEPEPEA